MMIESSNEVSPKSPSINLPLIIGHQREGFVNRDWKWTLVHRYRDRPIVRRWWT